MDYLTFREKMFEFGCFNVNQVLIHEKNFDRNNLTRWCRKGLIVKLRNEYYAFAECRREADFSRFVANRLYMPSYISCYSALSFYGMIPEEVVQVTSVTTLKTAKFENPFGSFRYQKVKTSLYFGYEVKIPEHGRGLLMATPEKALLDLLYLNPFYNTRQEMEQLRLDEDFMTGEFNVERMEHYLSLMDSKALEQRVKLLRKVYDI